MKQIYLVILLALLVKSNQSFSQLKADWTFYGPQFHYVDGKLTDGQFSVADVTDFKILKNGSFIFASKTGPVVVFNNGTISQLQKIMNVTGSVKSGVTIEGVQSLAVDKNDNLFLQLDRKRLFMIESQYFNGGAFKENSLGVIPAKRIGEEDGFIYRQISAVVSDGMGNIWVRGDISQDAKVIIQDQGAANYRNGIAKFDGTKWSTVDIFGTLSQPNSLVVFDEANNALMQFPNGRNSNIVMVQPAEIKPEVKSVTNRGEVLEDGAAVAMKYYEGSIYLATPNAVYVQKGLKWEKIEARNVSGINDIEIDMSGSLWIASNEGVTCVTKSGTQYQLNSENSILPTGLVRKIVVDRQNKKWFLSDGGLVGYKEPADAKLAVSIYTRLNSDYPNGKIQGIENFENSILMLNSECGIVRFDGTSFKKEMPNVVGGMFFNDLNVGKDGKAYIGTYRYLHTFDGKNYDKIDWKEDIGKQVNAVLMDDKGTLWIGFDGISKFENGSWQNYNKKNAGLSSNSVYKLFKDSKGNLWAILSDGVAKYDGTTWTSFTKKTTDIALRNMIGFAETKEGKILFCNGANLVEYDGTTMKDVAGFKAVGSIRNMILQDDGSLLIATEEKGIVKFKDGSMSFFNQATGLPSNAISWIFRDKQNNIWASFGFPPPAPSISTTFNTPVSGGGAAPPTPTPPTPKELFTKKLQASDIVFGLVKLSQL